MEHDDRSFFDGLTAGSSCEAPTSATVEAPRRPLGLGPVRLAFAEEGAATLRSVTLVPGGALRVGRGRGVEVRLHDGSVSALHARFEHDGRRVVVRDLGSRNGVRIGGALLREAEIDLGEVAHLGRVAVHLEAPEDEVPLGARLPLLLGQSRPMLALATEVRRAAPLRLPALVRGETGTGKDLVARALHDESPRRGGPFVALNAAAIARDLAESELFGHERGAFTGALRERRGAFREAHGGTLFIDEIAALAPELQAKLLRVVEDGVVRPLGGEARRPVDVRLVAATCEPLEVMVAARTFRMDLFERLAACVLIVPPLRERREDVELLARHLLEESGLAHAQLRPSAAAILRREGWPGNVRELRNVVVQAALRAGAEPIEAVHVTAALAARRSLRMRPDPLEARRLLEETGGNVSEAARRARLPRSSLRDLLRVR